MTVTHNCVLPNALRIPALTKLANKRIVLASASPRRLQILRQFGLDPEIVPSKFAEDLPHDEFSNVYEYPVATATEKAVEVYVRMVEENPDDPPSLVIAADTVVLTKIASAGSNIHDSLLPEVRPDILEKPQDKGDNLRMLLELNGYAIKSMDDRCIVHFHDSHISILEAYVDSEEGMDRAGGFALQERGAHLVSRVEGDFYNAVGFPGSAFFKWIGVLINEEDDFMDFDI
ncbi:N-acetylserotonin O-methyltransferase-like protein Short=ASMTL [Rhizoctonia solani AG-1 IB]|uniref:N-acetylserotonin O-methyltransferase-like protein Short=ASMTL n=1 Tax=Thanatephorus cucumeris (strain AG1-IB / isolate 7/3/14) TaxID=1108050 RepID=M5BRY0_THACB|nr:N-acetylserotonin O-methyltransferase-like protein Short=ASMTL [Rhizoctonia solani AG-1 IB]